MPTTIKKRTKASKPKPAPPAPEIEAAPEPILKPAPKPVSVPTESTPPPPPRLEVAQPAAPAPAPPRADLAAPMREKLDQPPPDPVTPFSAEPPPPVTPATFEEQAPPQPEVDVEDLKRQRALALAQLLREEETVRLDDTLDQEREARIVEARKRLEERERKLAQELGEIRTASQQRRDEQEAQEARDAAAREATEDYRARISAKIRQRVILPPDLQGNPEAIYSVSLLPGGKVTQVRLLQTSGVATYDAAVERAILAAQPLPVPEDSHLFQTNFKNLRLNFRPKE
jgi:colicin import membrane protein